MKGKNMKRFLAGLMCLTMTGTMLPAAPLTATAAGNGNRTYSDETAGGTTEVDYETVAAEKEQVLYNVDCGDFDVTTAPEGEEMGLYQSVTEQVYDADEQTGKKWGIVDDYEVTPPNDNLAVSNGQGIRTNWTWAQENGGFTVDSPKTSTNRYTKNQSENKNTFGDVRKLDYKFELDPGKYHVQVLCVAPWDQYGNISTYPEITLNGGKESEVSSKDYEAGKVEDLYVDTRNETDRELTVAFRATRCACINVAYIMISTENKYGSLKDNYDALSIEESVTKDFKLSKGTKGSQIEWSSDNAAITIDQDSEEDPVAVVTRGKTDTTVTLTATISEDGYSLKKTFTTVVTAKPSEPLQEVKIEDIKPLYNVDCGDFDVTTAPAGEEFGTYQSVTEQVYGADPETGKKWGIIDNYEATPPAGNLNDSGTGGIQTNWTWPQENGGFGKDSAKSETNRYTKNQYETRASFGEVRKLDYAFELEPGKYLVTVLCKDPWGCSNSPVITLNKGKDSEVSSENYRSGTATTLALDTTAETKTDVTLGLSGSGDNGTGTNNRAINLAYITISRAGYDNLYEDYVAAKVDKSVTRDFSLAQGIGDTQIVWTSDNEEAIEIAGEKAIVKRGSTDKEVTLTATIQNDTYYLTKTFKTTVKAEGASESAILIQNVDNTKVEVLDDYYRNAYNKEVDYLLSLSVDKLIAGFREAAAYAAGYDAAKRKEFMKNETRYGGWENMRIGGHTAGHYMSAISTCYVNPQATKEQKEALKKKIDECVQGLKECQEISKGSSACKDGFIFGATIDNPANLESQFDQVDKGQGWQDAWVPWYTMHKILAGLVDIYKYTGDEDALEVAVNLGMWTFNRVGAFDSTAKSRLLSVEYGGMNDALYELYDCMQGKEEYADKMSDILAAAEMFDEVNLFERVKNGGTDIMNNTHANTTIPKFIGALKRYIVLGEEESKYLVYAEKFWDMVIENHTYITGGNSENEHFGKDKILYAEETNVNNETCNTYNMLKLTRELFKITGDAKYADYYENTLINAIMSSQNPETGMSMYFQPMATGYHKVFGKPTTDFWCCTGSGMENFGKLNDSIYYRTDDTLIVNLYISSQIDWTEKNLKVVQNSGISDISSEEAEFTVESMDETDAQGSIAFRIPDWVVDQGNEMTVTLNGKKVTPQYFDFDGAEAYSQSAAGKRYILVNVKNGDKIKVTAPMKAVAYNLPDKKNAYAFKYGPVVLSAKLGNDPAYQTEEGHGIAVRKSGKKAVDSDAINVYAVEDLDEYMANINDYLVRSADGKSFELTGASFDHVFVPHYSQYTENYGIYWTYYIGGRDSAAVIREKNTNRKDRVLIDNVQAGYGQYEPGLEDTGHTGDAKEHIRYANAGGYFTYEVKVDDTEKNYLLLTLRREDDGKPLHISSSGIRIFDTDALDSKNGSAIQGMLSDADFKDYYQIQVEIPKEAIAAKYQNEDKADVILIKFEGTADQESARLYNWSYVVRGYETENHLESLTVNGETVDLTKGVYDLKLSEAAETFTVNAKIADTKGYVAVDDMAIEEEKDAKITINGYNQAYMIRVYAENFEETESFRIRVSIDEANIKEYKNNVIKHFTFDATLDDAGFATKAFPPKAISKEAVYGEGATDQTDKAVYLDGTAGLALGSAEDIGETYTVSFWMKPDKILGQYDPTFCAGLFSPEHWLNMTQDGKIWSRKSDYIATPASGAYKAGEWQMVTVVVDEKSGDGTNAKGTLYVNGKEVSAGNVALGIMTDTNAQLYFGVNAWDAYYVGYLDDLIILDAALPAKDVRALYAGEINGDGAYVGSKESEADKVTDMILNLGDITTADSSKKAIDAAKEAYEKLTDEEKVLVPSNILKTLENAEKTYNDKKAEEAKKAEEGKKETQTDVKKPAAVGTVITAGTNSFIVTSANASAPEVAFKQTTDKNAKKVSVPVTVTDKGITYTVTGIADNAFKGNKKVKSISLPAGVVKIGKNAFSGCTALTKIVIPAKVTQIGANAFKGDKNLKKITIKSTVLKKVGKNAFKGIHKKATIKVPKKLKKNYQKLLKKKGQAATVKVK